MDHLAQAGLIREDSRVDLLANRIALVAPASSQVAIAIAPGFDLAGALGPDGRLAMAETTSVPAGIYGRTALEHLGVWESVADRVAMSENVRAALALVSRGEVPLGIVYATDATADDAVRLVAVFPEETQPADRVSRRADGGAREPGRGRVPRLAGHAAGPAAFRAPGLHGARGMTCA